MSVGREPQGTLGAEPLIRIEERSDDVGLSRPAGPGILERSEKIRKGEKAAGYIRGGAPDKSPAGTQNGRQPPTVLWSLQGMILRPPDYESDALTN